MNVKLRVNTLLSKFPVMSIHDIKGWSICFSKIALTLKTPRKPASENVVCLCRLLNILANFSNLFLHTEEQSDLGPQCLQK